MEDDTGEFEDGEEWQASADALGVTMASYYGAVRTALEEMYNDEHRKTPPNWLLDDLAPQFKPRLGSLRAWKDDCINELIRQYRFYRYHVEEDVAMAEFLAYRDGVEYVFQNGTWTQPTMTHYRLRAVPPDKGEGRE